MHEVRHTILLENNEKAVLMSVLISVLQQQATGILDDSIASIINSIILLYMNWVEC